MIKKLFIGIGNIYFKFSIVQSYTFTFCRGSYMTDVNFVVYSS